MTTTEQILSTFTSKVDMEKEYTRNELGKMLTEVFKEIREGEKGEKKARKKAKKEDDGEDKKKREPTAYNLYVRETRPVVKDENPEMSRQDLMREVGRMWREKKGNVEDVKEEVEEVKKEVQEEVQEEVKKGKKGKKGKKE